MSKPLPQVSPDAGWDTTEIAESLGVANTTIRNWKARYADFPKPIGVREHSHWFVWDPDDVTKWFEGRKYRLSLNKRRSTFGKSRG